MKKIIVLLFLVVLALGCSSTDSEDNPEPIVAGCDGASDCLFSALGDLVDGFLKGGGHSLWGWMMGGGQSAGTTMIATELGQIEATLTAIDNELNQIETTLEKLACGLDEDFIAQYAAPIQAYYDQYSNWLDDMKAGSLPSQTDISEWANCAVGSPAPGQTCQNDNILTLMITINDLAAGTGGADGSISDCIIAGEGAIPAQYTLDDRPYYTENVLPITNWYLTINTQAIIVLTEAYHYRAWVKAGSPKSTTTDEIISNVCPTTGTVLAGCTAPIIAYNNDFLPFTKLQIRAGGAPYSADSTDIEECGAGLPNSSGWGGHCYVMVNGTDYLLAQSLEAYTLASGNPDNCDLSGLIKTAPGCGITAASANEVIAGKGLDSIAFGNYGYGDNYGIWTSAPEDVFDGIFGLNFNGTGLSIWGYEYLCAMNIKLGGDPDTCTQSTSSPGNGGTGLFASGGIILHPETTTYDLLGTLESIVFTDPSTKANTVSLPFNSNARIQQTLSETECFPNFVLLTLQITDAFKNGEGADFPWYNAWASECSMEPWTTPQYTYKYKNYGDIKRYTWPALNWKDLTCSDGSKAADATNPAGVPTLCGEDFDAWFKTQVPPGPTT